MPPTAGTSHGDIDYNYPFNGWADVCGEATSDGQECGNASSLQTTEADPRQLALVELQWLMYYNLFT